MICGLHIENIAVVKKLDVEFENGFCVLTGETGAGKSIIIDSLNLLLGARADKELIRRGESMATVSALFCDVRDEVCSLLGELGFESEEKEVSLTRSITAEGRSTARINGRVVTLSALREVAALLFNIHGQNDNQQILHAQNHIEILDKFAHDSTLVEEYFAIYKEILAIRTQIDSLQQDSMEKNRLGEMLKFQIADIDAAKLKAGEEDALLEEEKRLLGLEQINKCTSVVKRAISGGDNGVGASYLCDRASAALSKLADDFTEAADLAERLENIKYELDDIAESAAALADIGDGDPSVRLDKIGSRLDVITRLKRKYGSTVDEILAFRENAEKRLDEIENSDALIEDLRFELGEKESAVYKIARELNSIRKKAAKELTKLVGDSLEFLEMPKVRFEVAVNCEKELNPKGCDKVEFLIATNAGEPLMPMIKIASGGELARIMLSLKSALNDCDGMQTVIFDEIDTGISGKTSRKVGIKLSSIARSTQVICVTHSAQIASLADTHFYISKSEVDGRVQTSLKVLDGEARTEEIARILGGINITDAQRAAAREMIDNRE